jgi:outer membrane protein assembly factor BamA
MGSRLVAGYLLLLLARVVAGVPPDAGSWQEWTVRRVSCLGLERTDQEVILRELELRPGTGYDDRLLEADANAVKNTGLFASLVVTVRADSLDGSVEITYAVTERPAWIGYPILNPTEDLGIVYGAGLMHRNLGGQGRTLDAELRRGEHTSYRLRYVEPWFLGYRQPLQLRASRRISDEADGTLSRRASMLGLGLTRYYDRELSVGVHPWWQEVRIRDRLDSRPPETVNPRGIDSWAGLSFGAGINRTDYHVHPSRGWRLEGSVSAFGLGGSNQPAGWLADAAGARFRPLGPGVLAAQVAGGLTAGRRGDYMKRYLGGSQRVRAGESDRWPGWSTLHGALEWRLPLLERRVYLKRVDLALGAVLFVDGGWVWPEVLEGTPLAAGGVGAGLRIFVPFIEVARLDLAWSPGGGLLVRIGQGHAF